MPIEWSSYTQRCFFMVKITCCWCTTKSTVARRSPARINTQHPTTHHNYTNTHSVVQAWVDQNVMLITHNNPTVGLCSSTFLHTISDHNQTRPQHMTETQHKHYHHGDRASPLTLCVWRIYTNQGMGSFAHIFYKAPPLKRVRIDSVN